MKCTHIARDLVDFAPKRGCVRNQIIHKYPTDISSSDLVTVIWFPCLKLLEGPIMINFKFRIYYKFLCI